MAVPAKAMGKAALRLAQLSLLLSVFLLGWMKQPMIIGGLEAFPADLVFMITGLRCLFALLAGATKLRFDSAFSLVALYFAAMAVSLIVSPDPGRSAFKLLTQIYLLSLPVLTFNLVRAAGDLKLAFTSDRGRWPDRTDRHGSRRRLADSRTRYVSRLDVS